MTDPSEGFSAELLRARERGGQRVSRLRAVGVGAFLAIAVLLGPIAGSERWSQSLPLFALYAALAFALHLGSNRSRRVAGGAGLAIPLLDMPLVFLLQLQALPAVPNPEATAAFTTAVFVALLMLGALVLDARLTIGSALVASGLELLLLRQAGTSLAMMLSGVALIGLTALLSRYARQRAEALVGSVVDQQLRRSQLSRYFSPDVVAAIEDPTLPATRRVEVTLLFSDLRGFTTLSERLDGEHVVRLLGRYHERMVDVLFADGATIDKFLGDGIMAWFDSTGGRADHAERAIRCAIEMHRALMELNTESAATGEPELRMGIGIHTGSVILGDIGSAQRREYTAIGDPVNVAARIESLTKTLKAPVLVSEAARDAAGEGLGLSALGELEVRGKSQPIRVFAPETAPPITSGPA